MRHRTAIAVAPLSLVLLALIVSLPSVGMAQGIEEIIVTARKKEESLQEVPLSIAAFTARQMRTLGLNNNYDVAAFTPNFNTMQLVGRDNDRPVIRGMANPGSRGEPNASYFIDGVFVARTISTLTTAAMERVEVLRGPQSAIFGRATFSGAVNYITRSPTNEFEGEVFLRGGSSDDQQVSGWVSGPIVKDKLLFLASAAYVNYGGQWNNNLQPDTAFTVPSPDPFVGQNTEGDKSALGEEETTDFLAKLTWTPFDSTEINLKGSYTDSDDSHDPTNVFAELNCQLPDDPGEPWYRTSLATYCGEYKIDGTENRKNIPDFKNGLKIPADWPLAGDLTEEERFAVPVEPGRRREIWRFLGEWRQGIGDWNSVLRGSYSDDDFDSAFDLDHQEVRAIWGLFNFNNQFITDDYSVEYFLETPVDNPVRGKLGAYYYSQDLEDRQRSITGPLAVFGSPPGALFQDSRLREIENTSVFGSVALDLTEQWTLSVEARYAEDNLDIRSGQRNFDNDSSPVTDSLEYTAFTPRMTLDFRATDDMMFYLLLAKGNKPGGFNTEYYRSDIFAEYTEYLRDCDPDNPGMPPLIPGFTVECSEEEKSRLTFKEEEQWTYEVGMKSSWWDRRVTANLSAFYIDWQNQGLFARAVLPNNSGTTNTTTILVNAGQSEIYGLELESNFAATENLFLFANYGYQHGEFKEGTDPELASLTGGDGDLTGNRIPVSPDHSLVLGFNASAPINSRLDGFLTSDFLFASDWHNQASNFSTVGDRKIVNLRMGVQSDSWSLTFYVRNLLEDETPLSVFNFVNFALDPIETPPYPDGTPAENDGEPPNMSTLNPQRSRDYGLEFLYRFGGG